MNEICYILGKFPHFISKNNILFALDVAWVLKNIHLIVVKCMWGFNGPKRTILGRCDPQFQRFF